MIGVVDGAIAALADRAADEITGFTIGAVSTGKIAFTFALTGAAVVIGGGAAFVFLGASFERSSGRTRIEETRIAAATPT